MSTNLVLPFLSASVMFVFTAYVLRRYVARRRLNFLFWGVGLAMFGTASLSEAVLAVTWNRTVFFLWYLFGAILTAAWIGQGTVYLLVRKKRAHVLTVVLVIASLLAGFLLLRTMPLLDVTAFSSSVAISEQYREILPPVSDGGIVRLTTPFFNVYGLITLVGGALWSSYLFWRKRVLPNRVVGNVLIAAGALVIASASTLTRMGYGQFLYLGELLAATMMFVGFLVAAAPKTAPVKSEADPTAAATTGSAS
jgi:uncharacterized membrane protein HdeD (DUF308 family)